MTTHETAGVTFAPTISIASVLENYAHYPRPVRPLILAADTQPYFRDALSRGFHAVWLSLVSRIQVKHPEQPIKVRLSNVADTLGLSEKTVQRALKTFVNSKWIRPAPEHDGRDRFGRYSYREFIIEENARLRLGIKASSTALTSPTYDDANQESVDLQINDAALHFTSESLGASKDESALQLPESERADFSRQVETELSDGSVDNDAERGQESAKITATEQECPTAYRVNVNLNKDVKEIYKDFSENSKNEIKNQKQKPLPKKVTLPESLEILRDLGVYDGAICKLRHIAKQAGLRLEDVWGASWEYIMKAQITGGRLVKYLTTLIAKPDDYQGRAEQVARNAQATGWIPDDAKPGAPATLCNPPSGRGRSVGSPAHSPRKCNEDAMKAYSRKYSHKRFQSPDGSVVRLFDGTAEVIRPDRSCVSLAGDEAMFKVYQDIERCFLVENHA